MKAVKQTREIKLGRLGGGLIGYLVIICLSAPMLVVIGASLDPGQFFTFPPKSISARWLNAVFASGQWRSSLLFSLELSIYAAIVSMIIGTFCGIAIHHMSKGLAAVLSAAVSTPLVIPAIVLGVTFYPLALSTNLVGQTSSFVIVDTLVSVPLVTMMVASQAAAIGRSVEFASLSCGASRLRTFSRITLPLVAPGVAGGGLVAFLTAMNEVVISRFLVGPSSTPVSVRMFLETQSGQTPIITAVATVLIVGSVMVAIGGITLRGLYLRALRKEALKLSSTFIELSGATGVASPHASRSAARLGGSK